MGWVTDAIVELNAGRTIQVQAMGGSMRGRIESRQLVTLAPVDLETLMVDDAVLVRWQKDYLLHLVKAINGESVLIGNALGKINGTVSRTDVIGIVTHVTDEPVCTATVIGPVRHNSGSAFRVRFEDDTDVVAIVPKHVAKTMLRISPGHRVVVEGLWNAKYQIRYFTKDN